MGMQMQVCFAWGTAFAEDDARRIMRRLRAEDGAAREADAWFRGDPTPPPPPSVDDVELLSGNIFRCTRLVLAAVSTVQNVPWGDGERNEPVDLAPVAAQSVSDAARRAMARVEAAALADGIAWSAPRWYGTVAFG